jgi:hypothetical protein
MSRDTELSTDDLAQPGGTRREAPPASGEDSPGGTAGATAAGGTGASTGGTAAMGVEDRDVGQRQGGADPEGPPGGPGAGPGDGTAAREAGGGDTATGDTATGDMATRERGAGGTGADDRAATEGDDPGGGGVTTADAGASGSAHEPAGGGEEQVGGGQEQPGDGADVALLAPADEERFRQRWRDVQARFVDDPQEAVQTADGLVAELMQSLASGFSGHKGRLEAQWQSGGTPDTEELRQALQRYRSFFNRLLST